MAKEYKIKIENEIIGSELSESTTQVANEAPQAQPEKAVKQSMGAGIGKAVAANMAKQALAYATSNYGTLTGDYIGQTHINEALELGGLAAMAATGWVGIAAAVGNVGVRIANRYIDVQKSEIASANLRERTGLTRSGSR